MLADDLGYPFVELTREIERLAGCGVAEIHSLYGPPAYRRYERRALEETLVQRTRSAVIATPGGIVSEPATFNRLLEHCFTVWLQATPDEHMSRVIAQGDCARWRATREAMDDLQRILAGRSRVLRQGRPRRSTPRARRSTQSFAGLAAMRCAPVPAAASTAARIDRLRHHAL